MKITIIHQFVSTEAPADERDVLDQVTAIRTALTERGHAVSVLPCTTDLGNVLRKLDVLNPDCIFNLVETLDGSGRLIHLAPALWETKGLCFTGSSADALYLTTHKGLAKERMFGANLSTPPWIVRTATDSSPIIYGSDDGGSCDWIVKSIWEHASVGLTDSSILRNVSSEAVAEHLPAGFFAERFIDGREFNLALLDGPNGPEVLPLAEIVFVDFPNDKPKIVGYPAKWDEASFEYAHTVRRFADPTTDSHLIDKLKRLALLCWKAFDLTGYARVDFRVDARGKPWILEVNTNPCLSPDSGFAAALQKADIPYADAMERIVHVAQASHPCTTPAPTPQKTEPSSSVKRRPAPTITWRYEVTPADVAAIRAVTAATGYFHEDEIDVAAELVEERLAKGAASGYEFVLADCEGRLVGYTTFGPIPCTKASFDWYWLAVRPEWQGFGFGKQLLEQVEIRARSMGGTRLYAETSGRPQYATTRAFYEHMAFTLCEILADYYDTGDGRATYTKPL